MSGEKLSVDDLVTGRAAEQFGAGVIPTAAVLVVQTIQGEGQGLRFVQTEGLPSWQAIGMVRSALLRMEAHDLAGWDGDPEDLS